MQSRFLEKEYNADPDLSISYWNFIFYMEYHVGIMLACLQVPSEREAPERGVPSRAQATASPRHRLFPRRRRADEGPRNPGAPPHAGKRPATLRVQHGKLVSSLSDGGHVDVVSSAPERLAARQSDVSAEVPCSGGDHRRDARVCADQLGVDRLSLARGLGAAQGRRFRDDFFPSVQFRVRDHRPRVLQHAHQGPQHDAHQGRSVDRSAVLAVLRPSGDRGLRDYGALRQDHRVRPDRRDGVPRRVRLCFRSRSGPFRGHVVAKRLWLAGLRFHGVGLRGGGVHGRQLRGRAPRQLGAAQGLCDLRHEGAFLRFPEGPPPGG